MSNTLARTHDQMPGSDRRACMRHPIRSLAYVELDEGNGGIVLNISEGGLAVQAVTSLMDDLLPGVRFQLSETESWIEANARITWTSESRKLAGLEFIGLPDESRVRIREWLGRESLPATPADAAETATVAEPVAETPDEHKIAEPTPPLSEPVLATEFDVPREIAELESAEPKLELASLALADLLTSVTDHVPEVALAASALPVPEPAAKKSFHVEKLVANNWSAVTLLLFLAVVSLAAGWAAGEGSLGRYLGKIRGIPSQIVAQNSMAGSASAGRGAHISEIEVVNASNQHWTIPFNGPLNSPADFSRHQASAGPSSATVLRKPDIGFRTWVLTPPSQSRSTSDAGALKEPPPELSVSSAGGENVLTASGALSQHAVASIPALAVPAPPTPTGIVKQGQLIYRVDPTYPMIAKEQRAEGTVRLNVTVGPDGIVRGVALLGGPRLLVDAAERAVRQWRYTPTLLNGEPVEFQREVDLTFRLASVTR